MRELERSEIDSLFQGRCPACGQDYEGFYEGGSGGMSMNIYCANEECQAGYNLMGPAPAVNLGGQLIRASKLGDVRAPEPLPPAAAATIRLGTLAVLLAALAAFCVGVGFLIGWLTG